jgi:NAD(P)-dependent dehydrogenase (short-subunit alcohol dehydrogenase family)
MNKQIWFVTGAGRGMGVDIAKAALAAGHGVVATGRNSEQVSSALGSHAGLIVVRHTIRGLRHPAMRATEFWPRSVAS